MEIFIPNRQDLLKQEIWMREEAEKIGEATLQELVGKAVEQRKFAYAPYSGYHVGAAILTHEGAIFTGANAERVSYSESDHAEQAAITAAVSAGAAQEERKFLRALVVCHEGTDPPCGHCRQIIVEHSENCLIIVASPEGSIRYITSIQILLPHAFTPDSLEK